MTRLQAVTCLFTALGLAGTMGGASAQMAPNPTPFNAIQPYVIPVAEAVSPNPPVAGVDMRPRIAQLGLTIKHQGLRGTCSMFAVAFVLEYVYAVHRGFHFRDLSEEYLNATANLVVGKNIDGDFFSNIDAGFQRYGIVPEAVLPYRPAFDPSYTVPADILNSGRNVGRLTPVWIKHWDNRVGASEEQLTQVRNELLAGRPVATGLWWPYQSSFTVANVNGIPLMGDPGKRGGLADGHSVALVGFFADPTFPGGGYFILRNSWGPGWDKGYGYISYDYVRRYANDLLTYR